MSPYLPTIALTSPAISIGAVSLYKLTSIIPFRMVSPTLAPRSMEPRVSNMEARMQAWRSVTTPDPTAVPNEFATSLAPTENARMKAIMKPSMTIHRYVSVSIMAFVHAKLTNESQSTTKNWSKRCTMKEILPHLVFISPNFPQAKRVLGGEVHC